MGVCRVRRSGRMKLMAWASCLKWLNVAPQPNTSPGALQAQPGAGVMRASEVRHALGHLWIRGCCWAAQEVASQMARCSESTERKGGKVLARGEAEDNWVIQVMQYSQLSFVKSHAREGTTDIVRSGIPSVTRGKEGSTQEGLGADGTIAVPCLSREGGC